jgi:signal transduction histidine kinase
MLVDPTRRLRRPGPPVNPTESQPKAPDPEPPQAGIAPPATPKQPPARPPESRASRVRQVGFLVGWTVLVGIAIGILGTSAGPAPSDRILLLGPAGDAALAWSDRLRHGLWLAHVSLHCAYPWILLAPYLVALVSRFPLERGRWLSRGPLLFLAAAAWLAASAAVDRLSERHLPDALVFAALETSEAPPPAGPARLPPDRGPRMIVDADLEHRGLPRGEDAEALPGMVSNLLGRLEARVGTGATAGASRVIVESRLRLLVSSNGPAFATAAELTNDTAGGDSNPPAPHLAFRMEHRRRTFSFPGSLDPGRIGSLLLHFLAFASLVGIAHARHFQRRYRDREHRALTLESQVALTRLHALQAQLHPHFLFNTLNSVTALLRENPRAAEEMLISLSDLLRLVLSQSNRPMTPLREELRFVELYVEIQQFRFGDRLRYEATVDPDAWDCLVPTLLLQPLVENAIRHGLEPAGRPGGVRVSARRLPPDRLELAIEDDGVGCPRLSRNGPPPGVGLANVRARLATLFGGAAEVAFPPGSGTGFAVRLRLPARTETAEPAPAAATATPTGSASVPAR